MPKGFVGWAIVPAAGFEPAFSTLLAGAAVAKSRPKERLLYLTRMTTMILWTMY
jgi:hypothetical protein